MCIKVKIAEKRREIMKEIEFKPWCHELRGEKLRKKLEFWSFNGVSSTEDVGLGWKSGGERDLGVGDARVSLKRGKIFAFIRPQTAWYTVVCKVVYQASPSRLTHWNGSRFIWPGIWPYEGPYARRLETPKLTGINIFSCGHVYDRIGGRMQGLRNCQNSLECTIIHTVAHTAVLVAVWGLLQTPKFRFLHQRPCFQHQCISKQLLNNLALQSNKFMQIPNIPNTLQCIKYHSSLTFFNSKHPNAINFISQNAMQHMNFMKCKKYVPKHLGTSSKLLKTKENN